MAGDDLHPIGEGDAVYLPVGVPHQILDPTCGGWLTYLIAS